MRLDVSARSVLWWATFTGFAMNYVQRINMNIAIVGMVKSRINNNGSTAICTSDVLQNFTDIQQRQISEKEKFDWDEKVQSNILGGFYWLHWMLQVPGGLLSARIGAKAVFGLSNLIGCLLGFLVPLAAETDHRLLVAIRVLTGLVTGVTWPSAQHLMAQWIPPNERSKFVSSFLGSSVGTAVMYPVCGYVMDQLGWRWVFYLTGVLGTVWYLAWYLCVFSTPSSHPRIDPKERKYIEEALGSSLHHERFQVPWRELMTSRSVWMIIIVQWGGTWGLFTMLTQAPTYFKIMFAWHTTKTGLYSGAPHLGRAALAILYGVFSDYLLRNSILSRTKVRKLAVIVCTILQGLVTLGLAVFPACNENLAFLLVFTAVSIHGAVSSGPLPNVADLSPNFAGVIQGVVGTVVSFTGILSAYVVGILTHENQTKEQWEKVWYICTGMLLGTGSLFLLLGQARVQPWNSPRAIEGRPAKELRPLNPTRTT